MTDMLEAVDHLHSYGVLLGRSGPMGPSKNNGFNKLVVLAVLIVCSGLWALAQKGECRKATVSFVAMWAPKFNM